jgi:hypothetical protein
MRPFAITRLTRRLTMNTALIQNATGLAAALCIALMTGSVAATTDVGTREGDGVDPEWSAGILSQIEHEEYRASRFATGFQAPNRAHNLRTHFRSSEIDIRPRLIEAGAASAAWHLTWRTTAWGRANRLVGVESADCQPRLEGEYVTYSRAGLDEWYENKKEGLEQGFALKERPTGEGALLIVGQFGGGVRLDLRPEVGAVDVIDEHGARLVRYGELHVWDSRGEELPSRLEVEGIEVALVIDDAAAVYPVTVDPLVTSPDWTGESNQNGANFGYSVATAGDVNGDGFSDVIVGAYLYDNGEADEGRAFVFHGSAAGLSTTPAWTAESNQAGALFGTSVSTAGDVNGDGFSDVIVGANLYDNIQGNEGWAFAYYGSESGLATTAAWTAESNQSDAYFGFSVATAGDVNGDGFSDVICGAPFYGNEQGEGGAFVYHGSAGGLVTAPAWTAEANQTFAEFGTSVATAGDVNGDGFSDVVVGAIKYDNGETDEGRAFAYNGSAAGLDATPDWTTESNQVGAYFGGAVATAGDVNGDGFSDVIVGAQRYDNLQTNEGVAFAYYGSAVGLGAGADWTDESNLTDGRFGCSVANAGDVNGDGFSDVIVGAHQTANDGQTNEGHAFAYHGSPAGLGDAITAVESVPSPIRRALLGPSSPNPFRGATEIAFTLPATGPTRLAVFDLAGRRAVILVDAVRDAGTHTLRWDGRDAHGAPLSAGVYLLRLEFGGNVEARRVVLAR